MLQRGLFFIILSPVQKFMIIFTLVKKGKQSAHGFFQLFYLQNTPTNDSILQGYASNLKRIRNTSLIFLA